MNIEDCWTTHLEELKIHDDAWVVYEETVNETVEEIVDDAVDDDVVADYAAHDNCKRTLRDSENA